MMQPSAVPLILNAVPPEYWASCLHAIHLNMIYYAATTSVFDLLSSLDLLSQQLSLPLV